jgi:transposase, IS5 family
VRLPRGLTDKIKRWLKRRAVVEPVIGHAKNDGLLGRNWLAGRNGDRIRVATRFV